MSDPVQKPKVSIRRAETGVGRQNPVREIYCTVKRTNKISNEGEKKI